VKKASSAALILFAFVIVVAICLESSGGIMVFTDRGAWLAANGGSVDSVQSFSIFNIDYAVADRKRIAFPGFSVLQEPGFAINFRGNLQASASQAIPLFLAWNNEFTSFATEISSIEGALQLNLVRPEILVRSALLPIPVESGFFGLISSTPFSGVAFSSAASDESVRFVLDNVQQAGVVPEPSGLIIFAGGLCLVAGFVGIRRYSRQCSAV
jgi:hypothetical protein